MLLEGKADMDELSEKINSFIAASEAARVALSATSGLVLESIDVRLALYEVLNIPPANYWELLDRRFTSNQIIEHLKSFNFKKLKPELLAEIELAESILPDGIPRSLNEETVKIKGEVWRIYKNDVDPFPSSPHAHYESGIVLHLGTGEMFSSANKNSVGNIGCKKLMRLRGELGAFMLPITESVCNAL